MLLDTKILGMKRVQADQGLEGKDILFTMTNSRTTDP